MDTPNKLMDSDILVVDDEESVIADMRQHLEADFGPIVGFVDPAKAARHLRSGERYKVILLDAEMKPLNGLALLKLARHLDPPVQVLITTSQLSMDVVVQAMQLGAVDFVNKPVSDWPALVRSLKRASADYEVRTENQRLMKELKERNDELDRTVRLLRQLNQTTEAMHQTKDVKQILNMLLKSACTYLEARRVSIMIRDPKRGQMAIQVAEGVNAAVIKEVVITAKEGIAGQVMESKEPLVVNDASSDPRVPKDPQKDGRYQGNVFMSIPIIKSGRDGKEQVMGVVNVTNRLHDRPFSPAEVEFVCHMARQAALAVTGAALWQTIANLASTKDDIL